MTSPPIIPDHFIDGLPFPCTVNEHKSHIHNNQEIRNPVHYNNQSTYLKRSRTCKYYMRCGCRRNDCPFDHYIDQNSALYPIYIALKNIERRQMNSITSKKQYESLTHEIKQQNLHINKLYEENKRFRAEMNGIRKCIHKTNNQTSGAQIRLDYNKDSVFKDMMNKVESLEQNISSNLNTKFEKIDKSLQKQMQSIKTIQSNIVKKLDQISNREIVELIKNQSSAMENVLNKKFKKIEKLLQQNSAPIHKYDETAKKRDQISNQEIVEIIKKQSSANKKNIDAIQNTLSNLSGIILSHHSIKANSSKYTELEQDIRKDLSRIELVLNKDKMDETLSKSLNELELKWSLQTENKEEKEKSIKTSSIYIDGTKERNESHYLRELRSQTIQCNILINQAETTIDEYNNIKNEFDTKYHEIDYSFNFEYQPDIVQVVDEGLLMIKDLLFWQLGACFIEDIDEITMSISDESTYEESDGEETKYDNEKD